MKSCLAFGKIVWMKFVEFYWYGVYYCFPQHSEWVTLTSGGFFKNVVSMYFPFSYHYFFMSQHTELNLFIGWFDCLGYRVFVLQFIDVINFFSCLGFIFLPHIFFISQPCLSVKRGPLSCQFCYLCLRVCLQFKCSCNSHYLLWNWYLLYFLTHLTHFKLFCYFISSLIFLCCLTISKMHIVCRHQRN